VVAALALAEVPRARIAVNDGGFGYRSILPMASASQLPLCVLRGNCPRLSELIGLRKHNRIIRDVRDKKTYLYDLHGQQVR
jgi:hypothetical protein